MKNLKKVIDSIIAICYSSLLKARGLLNLKTFSLNVKKVKKI